ncbi:MAG TPA: YdiU family protein [Nevskiaceae bacterium]
MDDATAVQTDAPGWARGWRFDNRFAHLGARYGSATMPTPLADPELVAFNPDAASLLDLRAAAATDPEFLAVMAGNRLLPGMEPYAAIYAGHQFGTYVPRLGDGRALLLGAVRNQAGGLWELQLKGCGRTPYSRFADGRAVLRSTIREYLASEAMHGLGIPTTRALAVVASSERVQRERPERAAVLCRLAPDYVRFGSFEYFYRSGQADALAPLADHVIALHHPELEGAPDRYRAWLVDVVRRTARLMAAWQSVGFIHGVMNTDNFSILGLTLDYGPWAFFDAFIPAHVFNHTDDAGRYTWARQPQVGFWNVARLLEACLPLLAPETQAAVEAANAILDEYPTAFHAALQQRWADKLGLLHLQPGDEDLIHRWLQLMADSRADFSLSFRALAQVTGIEAPVPALRERFTAEGASAALEHWLADYRARLAAQDEDDGRRRARMERHNPRFVLRTHLAQHAVERAQAGDFGEIERLRKVLTRPFDEQPENADDAKPPAAAEALTVLSCSS